VTSGVGDPFGSVVVAPGTGFVLANELEDFNMGDSNDPDNPEKPGPGTANEPNGGNRPRSSQSPTIVVKAGRPVLVVGGAGGTSIPLGVIQSIVNIVDFGLDIADAVDAERIEGTFYRPALGIEDKRVDDAVKDDLEARGHALSRNGEYSPPPIINAVGFNPAGGLNGLNEAVSDPRNEMLDQDPGQGAAGQS